MTNTVTAPRAHSHGAGAKGSHASRADRPTSFSVADIPTPRGREEDWRFTPMRRIERLFDPADYTASADVQVSAPSDATIERVSRDDQRLGTVLAPGDRTAVVAWDVFKESTVVTIPANAEVEDLIVLDVRAGGDLASDHILIKAGVNSRATVLLRHTSAAEGAALNQTVEIRADDGATLKVIATQEWDRDALHASNHRLSVGRDATIEHLIVTLGGDLVRICVDTEYTGPGGALRLNGIYFVDAGQHLEHRVFVAHSAPKCFSRVTYKGALQGKGAHAVWIGDCLIGEDADGTDTYELNRNLVLTEGAKADSVPNLEIENGEIEGAGHASATGRFDDEQLFYLMSRGISEHDARRLVVRGFFAELINEIENQELRAHLLEAIEAELATTEANRGN